MSAADAYKPAHGGYPDAEPITNVTFHAVEGHEPLTRRFPPVECSCDETQCYGGAYGFLCKRRWEES